MHAELQRSSVKCIAYELRRHVTDFTLLEPVATYMSFLFGTDIAEENIACRMGTPFLLNPYTVKEKKITELAKRFKKKGYQSKNG